MVGLGVGAVVGAVVGLGVGDAVGLGVGDAVGLGVGNRVGIGKTSSQLLQVTGHLRLIYSIPHAPDTT